VFIIDLILLESEGIISFRKQLDNDGKRCIILVVLTEPRFPYLVPVLVGEITN
jgi:hypothetical protein